MVIAFSGYLDGGFLLLQGSPVCMSKQERIEGCAEKPIPSFVSCETFGLEA
jgi:hypothetical protein